MCSANVTGSWNVNGLRDDLSPGMFALIAKLQLLFTFVFCIVKLIEKYSTHGSTQLQLSDRVKYSPPDYDSDADGICVHARPPINQSWRAQQTI